MSRSFSGKFTRLDEFLLSAGKTQATLKSRIIAFLFSGAFFLAGCAVFFGATISPLLNYYGSRDWQQAPATITSSKLDWDDDSARVEIHYKYRISGTDYTGDRFGWDGSRQNFGIEEKRRVTKRYKTGKPIHIWFDPDNPSQSVIDRSETGISGMTLLFPIPFLLVGVCGLSYAFFGGLAAARTRELFGTLAGEAESKGLTTLAHHLRYPPAEINRSSKLVFTMAQSWIEGLALLFACIFWNGIVGVFLSLLVVMILSGEGQAIFLGLFLIPFVLIGIFLIHFTTGKLRSPRPPAFAISFSELGLSTGEMEIPVTWMDLSAFAHSPDAANIRLGILRDVSKSPFSFRKAKEPTETIADNSLTLDQDSGEATIRLEAIPKDPKAPSWKTTPINEVRATFSWEQQPRREKRSVSWSLITPESDG